MKTYALANSDEPKPFEALENAATEIDADGWCLIAPFGRWPKTYQYAENGVAKTKKFIQALDNESADALVSKDNSFFGKIKRALIGVPVYKLHGDIKDVDPKSLANSAEKIKVGVVDQIRKSARGIEAHFALDNDGADAVNAGYKFPSAYWWVLPTGLENDSIIAKPFKLISVALTQFPNISGVESLANQRDAGPIHSEPTINHQEIMFKENIIGLLIGKGVALPNNPSETQILTALANGDYVGHEFHGNQYSAGEAHGAEHEASRKAHLATNAAADKASHEKAAAAHAKAAKAQAKAGNDDAAALHEAAAKFHTGRAARFK